MTTMLMVMDLPRTSPARRWRHSSPSTSRSPSRRGKGRRPLQPAAAVGPQEPAGAFSAFTASGVPWGRRPGTRLFRRSTVDLRSLPPARPQPLVRTRRRRSCRRTASGAAAPGSSPARPSFELRHAFGVLERLRQGPREEAAAAAAAAVWHFGREQQTPPDLGISVRPDCC